MKNWGTLILGLLLSTNPVLAALQEVDKIVAVVNNAVILKSDIDALSVSVTRSAQRAGHQLPDESTLRHQILERLIMDSILLQMAQKTGIKITETMLDKAIMDIATENNLSIAQLRHHLAIDGINYDDYREQIRKDILISEIRNYEVRQRITILPQEVDVLSKQLALKGNPDAELNLRHILLALPENPSEQQVRDTENLANKLIAEIKQGADFAQLAMTYSADSQALQGGKMGWTSLQELPSLFAEKLNSARKGEVAGPIRSASGFHIFVVNDVRGADKAVPTTEVHVRHILLKSSVMMTDAQAREKLSDIAQKIRNGEGDFTSFARQISQDTGSAEQGGDLGWSSPTRYDPAFRDALLQLKKNEISAPVKSAFGVHLIQLIDSRQVDETDAVRKNQVYQMLFSRKFAQEAQSWMQEQRVAAFVKILDGHDARE